MVLLLLEVQGLLAAHIQLVHIRRAAEKCVIWVNYFSLTVCWEIVESLLLKLLACFAKKKEQPKLGSSYSEYWALSLIYFVVRCR